MSRRHFSVLLITALLVAGAVALLLPGSTGREDTKARLLLSEELTQNIEAVDRLVISGAGGTPVSTIVRGQDRWTIGELAGYPADWGKLRGLLADLVRTEVVEVKTSNPEYYARLGVEDTSTAGAQGVLLEIFRGDLVTAVIVGNEAQSFGGQFVRVAAQPQSVLVDRSMDISAAPLHWAETAIVDIGSSLIAELEILHPDGNRILLRKVSADQPDFSLENLPPERELLSSWSVNSLANSFTLLSMEGVIPDTEIVESDAVMIRALTFSGLEIRANIFKQDSDAWLKLTAAAPGAADADESDELGMQAAVEQQNLADVINERTLGWVFRLPETKAQSMTKRLEEVLKPLQANEDNSGRGSSSQDSING